MDSAIVHLLRSRSRRDGWKLAAAQIAGCAAAAAILTALKTLPAAPPAAPAGAGTATTDIRPGSEIASRSAAGAHPPAAPALRAWTIQENRTRP